ncbi:MAG: sensor histidine kinase [Pirellulales bacterium]
MPEFESPQSERRSLLAKFRFAVLFQALLTLGVALLAIVPTLQGLRATANRRREDAKREVIDSGVNNMARLLAMDLGRECTMLHEAAHTRDAEFGLDSYQQQVSEFSDWVAEKVSYNSVLVNLVVVVIMPDVEPPVMVFVPDRNRTLNIDLDEAVEFLSIQQLSRVLQADGGPWAKTTLIEYLQTVRDSASQQVFIMPIRRQGYPFGFAAMVVDTTLISDQFENQWSVFWRDLRESLALLAVVTLVALAGGAVFILVLASRLIKPLEGMRNALDSVHPGAAGLIDPGDLRQANLQMASVAADPLDEVGALRNSFLELSENLAEALSQKAEALESLKESTQQLQRADRLKLVGTLTYSLAHNLNNALAPITNVAHAAGRRHADDQKLAEMMQMVTAAVARSKQIVDRLRDLTRVGAGQRVPVDLGQALDEAIEATRRDMTDARIRLERDIRPVPPLAGNPVELWEVFVNLLVNAREALARMPADHPRRIDVRALEVDGDTRIEIADNGPGMTPEVRALAIQSWFSTKPEKEASGIGLWISRRIVEEHGGRLEIESKVGRGTTVRLVFAASPSAQTGSPDDRAAPADNSDSPVESPPLESSR